MFEYIIYIPFPLKVIGEETQDIWTPIARYNFDLGLQQGEEFFVKELHFGTWNDEPFSFNAIVSKKEKFVKPDSKNGDIFIIAIYLDIADKEELTRMKEILMRLNPGVFEEFPITESEETPATD